MHIIHNRVHNLQNLQEPQNLQSLQNPPDGPNTTLMLPNSEHLPQSPEDQTSFIKIQIKNVKNVLMLPLQDSQLHSDQHQRTKEHQSQCGRWEEDEYGAIIHSSIIHPSFIHPSIHHRALARSTPSAIYRSTLSAFSCFCLLGTLQHGALLGFT